MTPAARVAALSAPSRVPAGRDAMVRWYQRVVDAFRANGFTAPIVDELADAVAQLATA